MDLVIVNADNFIKLMDSCSFKQQKNIIQGGLRKVSRIILNQGKANYKARKHSRTNKRTDAILSKLKIKQSKNNIFQYNVGTGYWIAGWLNSGTAERFYKTKRNRIHKTGNIKANNFWFDAVKSTKDEALKQTEAFIFNNLTRILKKNNKQNGN